MLTGVRRVHGRLVVEVLLIEASSHHSGGHHAGLLLHVTTSLADHCAFLSLYLQTIGVRNNCGIASDKEEDKVVGVKAGEANTFISLDERFSLEIYLASLVKHFIPKNN